MKTWIWDFDGTLFDSYPRMHGALVKALAEFGIFPPAEESMGLIKGSVGQAVRHYAMAIGVDAEVLMERYKALEAASEVPLVPYPGIAELCKRHIAAGGQHILYTHRNRSALGGLADHGLDGCFVDAVTIEDPFPKKPAPDALLYLIEKNGLDKADTVMIGDRDIDVIAGENAGIKGCLFDPEHFYDDYQTELRTDTVEGIGRLLLD